MSNKKRISRFEKEKSSLDEIKSLRLKVWSQQLENAMLRAQIAIVSSQPKPNSYAPGGWVPAQKREFKIIGETGTPEILSTFNGEKLERINENVVAERWKEYILEKHPETKLGLVQYLQHKAGWADEDFNRQYLSNPISASDQRKRSE